MHCPLFFSKGSDSSAVCGQGLGAVSTITWVRKDPQAEHMPECGGTNTRERMLAQVGAHAGSSGSTCWLKWEHMHRCTTRALACLSAFSMRHTSHCTRTPLIHARLLPTRAPHDETKQNQDHHERQRTAATTLCALHDHERERTAALRVHLPCPAGLPCNLYHRPRTMSSRASTLNWSRLFCF